VSPAEEAGRGLNTALVAVRLADQPTPGALDALVEQVAACRALGDDLPATAQDELAMAEAIIAGRTDAAHLEPTRRRFEELAAHGDLHPLLAPDVVAQLAALFAGDRAAYEAGMATFRGAATGTAEKALRAAVSQQHKKDRAAAKAERATQRDDGLPFVPVDRLLRHMSDEARQIIEAANEPTAARPVPTLFRRSGGLAAIRTDDGRHTIERVTDGHMRHRLSRVANTVRDTQDGWTPAPAPADLIGDLLVRSDWRLPALDAVVEAPVLRPDGTVVSTRGYDAPSRVVYAPARGLDVPTIPDDPTAEQVAAALGMVGEALEGFPFDGPASRAAAFALLLTPIVRPAIGGAVPILLVTAPQAGTGKSLLLDLTAVLATGRPAAMLAVPQREEEVEKTLLAALMEGPAIVAFDNLDGALKSSSLARAVTAKTFSGRILKESTRAEVPVRATWVVTGNNIRIGGDLARRTVPIRLDAKTAMPWQRAGYAHPNLLGWATANRGALVAALLTLARAWWAAGQPAAPTPHLGSFEDWTRIVGGILHHAGIDGFLDTLNDHYEQADDESAEWETFLRAWHYAHGEAHVLVKTLAASVQTENSPLRDALPTDLADLLTRPGVSFVRRFGKALATRADRRYGTDGIHVRRAGNARKGTAEWQVVIPAADATDPPGMPGMPGFTAVVTRSEGSNTPGYQHHEREPVETNPANPANPAQETTR
jgi:hypothetical protein